MQPALRRIDMKRNLKNTALDLTWIWPALRPFTFTLSLVGALGWWWSGHYYVTTPPEICENGIDDDGDGLIDLKDPQCFCEFEKPISLIPNPSFEEKNCCPSGNSQLNCAVTWIQASEATTDYVNTCGWTGWPNLQVPMPIPDGEGCVGFRNGRFRGEDSNPNWKEYSGACLTRPLRKGGVYLIQFHIGFLNEIYSPATNVVFYGSTDCKNLPFGQGNPRFGCPTNGPGWVRLGSVHVGGVNSWVQYQIRLQPTQDMYAIAIGPDCVEISAQDDIYYFFDNLILAEQEAFQFTITPNEPNVCSREFTLEIPEYDTIQYQWFKDGSGLAGETHARLSHMYGQGQYQVRMNTPGGCSVTYPFSYQLPRIGSEKKMVLCEGETLKMGRRVAAASGIYYDTLQSRQGCDSIVKINLTIETNKERPLAAKIFPDEKFPVGPYAFNRPGDYRAPLISQYGCDSVIALHLEYYKVFIPSGFSPNGDGYNDRFGIFGDAVDLEEISRLTVFDRWGNLIYQQDNMLPNDADQGWDGTHQGQRVPNGVYVYAADLKMNDGITRRTTGTLTLMR